MGCVQDEKREGVKIQCWGGQALPGVGNSGGVNGVGVGSEVTARLKGKMSKHVSYQAIRQGNVPGWVISGG